MNAPEPAVAAPSSRAEDGLMTRWVKKMFLRRARVVAVEQLSAHFCRISLQGSELADLKWTPGDKIQLNLGEGFSTRTYTPVSWDGEHGRLQFLAYLHGGTATCRWLAAATPGMQVQLTGPRGSLDLPAIAAPQCLFGDETGFGLAAALHGTAAGAAASFIFEVDDIHESKLVLNRLGILDATLVERAAADWHLVSIHTEMLRLAAPQTQFILTGQASAIQMVKKALATAGVPNTRIKAKAYWAQGKMGLD